MLQISAKIRSTWPLGTLSQSLTRQEQRRATPGQTERSHPLYAYTRLVWSHLIPATASGCS